MAWVIYQGLMTSWGKLIGPVIKQKGTYHFIRDLFVINYRQNTCCFDICNMAVIGKGNGPTAEPERFCMQL